MAFTPRALRTSESRLGSAAHRRSIDEIESSTISFAREWSRAKQLLFSLREPGLWRESVIERISMHDDRVFRSVNVKIAAGQAAKFKDASDAIHLIVMKPRKGVVSSVHVEVSDGQQGARTLSHREHVLATQFMLLFRFTSVVSTAIRDGLISENDRLVFRERARGLIADIPTEPDAAAAMRNLSRHFAMKRRWLRQFPGNRKANPELAYEMELLFRLCSETAERYYKVVRVPQFTQGARHVRYRYEQPIENRPRGTWPVRTIKRALRAPSNSLYIHVPMARLTDHYEFTMEPIAGYYVLEQRAMIDLDDNDHPAKDRVSPWWSKEGGRLVAPGLFIGDGTTARGRMHVGVQFDESPPGAIGHAVSAQSFALIAAFGLVWWSLTHSPSNGFSVAEVLAILLAIGSSAVDWLIPRTQLLNAPALPRVALYLQSMALVALSLWMLIRGTRDSLNPTAPGWPSEIANWVTEVEWVIGPTVLVLMFALMFVVARRVRSNVRNYYLPRTPGIPIHLESVTREQS